MLRFLRAVMLGVPAAAILLMGCTQADPNPKIKDKAPEVKMVTPPAKPGGQ